MTGYRPAGTLIFAGPVQADQVGVPCGLRQTLEVGRKACALGPGAERQVGARQFYYETFGFQQAGTSSSGASTCAFRAIYSCLRNPVSVYYRFALRDDTSGFLSGSEPLALDRVEVVS